MIMQFVFAFTYVISYAHILKFIIILFINIYPLLFIYFSNIHFVLIISGAGDIALNILVQDSELGTYTLVLETSSKQVNAWKIKAISVGDKTGSNDIFQMAGWAEICSALGLAGQEVLSKEVGFEFSR